MAEELQAPRAARDRRLVRVMLAFSLFSLVEYAVWVAVLLYAYARGGASLAGLVGVAELVPAAVLAPIFGSVGDRLPRGAALSGAYATEAATIGVLAALLMADAPIVAVVVAAAAATTVISVARPIHYASLPQLATTPRALVSANAACGVAEGITAFAGPVIAGLVAHGAGPWLVAALSSLAMLASALLATRLRLPVASAGDDGAGALRSAAAGLRSVSSDRPVLPPAVVLLALCGLGQAFGLVAGRTLLQRSTDDRVLARVFAVQEGVMMAGVAGGAALAPVLIGRLGAARGYLPLGVGLVVIALLAWPVLGRLDLRAVIRVDVLAVLRRVSFLAALSPPALERLSQAAQWVEVQVGDVVGAAG